MRLSAHIGANLRTRVETFARKRKLSLSDALRVLIVRAAGGTDKQAKAVNDAMAVARAKARADVAKPRSGAPRTSGASEVVVSVRVPGEWARKLAPGGLRGRGIRGAALREAIERGLGKN